MVILALRRCEACRDERAVCEVPNEPGPPFVVCKACKKRLEAFALRPLEWFRLAVVHGWWSYLLRDDFYDDDGEAFAPEVPVVNAKSFPFPPESEWGTSLAFALDIAYVKWSLPDVLLPTFSTDPVATLATIRETLEHRPNPQMRSIAYEVCAKCLGPAAAEWLCEEWQRPDSNDYLLGLACASAACLPQLLAFQLVETALRAVPPGEQPDQVACLSWFPGPNTLALLESLVVSPVRDGWGRAAACCGLDWARVCAWFAAGRPLSLVAFDALRACVRHDTLILRELRPRLRRPPEAGALVAVLVHQRAIDPSPRVKQAVDRLLGCVDMLIEGRYTD